MFSHRIAAVVGQLLLAGAVMAAGDADKAPPIPNTPGYHDQLPLPKVPGATYDLYLPTKYQQVKGQRHPVLFVLGGSYPQMKETMNTLKLPEWAESVDAVVIGVNQMFNVPGSGMYVDPRNPRPGIEVMDAYMALADAIPGTHPTLRLLAGGETYDGQRLTAVAARYPKNLAGVVFGPRLYAPPQNQPFPQISKDTGVCVVQVTAESYAAGRPESPYVMDWGRDPFEISSWEKTVGAALARMGNPVVRVETPDWRPHSEEVTEGLWWLLDSARLVKAGGTLAERDAAMKEILARMEKAAEEQDPIVREYRLRQYLALPIIPLRKEAAPLVAAWRKSILPAGEARTDLAFRYDFYAGALANPLLAGSPELKAVSAALEALRTSDAGKVELTARQRVREIVHSPNLPYIYGTDTTPIVKARQALQAVIQQYPNAVATKEAVAWDGYLARRLEAQQEMIDRSRAPRPPLERP